jgi:hypothetical protein
MVWFSEVDLRMAAGPAVFGRGLELVDAVRDAETTAEGVRGLVRGSADYKVFLGPSSPGLFGECDCPFPDFCKHCVALGLAVLSRDSAVRSVDAGAPQVGVLQRQLDAALWVRSSVDRAGSLEYARIAEEFLDTVEKLVAGGHAAEARPLARRAVERISESLLLIDDSPGSVGAACQRALTLYARACVLARPNAIKLAGWLFQLQLNSPGLPVVTIADFAPALGESGLTNYRALVDEAWAGRTDAGESDIRGALSLLLMRERLAQPDPRPAPVEELPDPAVFLGVSGADPVPWLVEFLVQAYLDGDRPHDALEIRRSQLRIGPCHERYVKLRDTASSLRQWPLIRPWALEIIRSAPADEQVTIHLDEGDVDAAWSAAQAPDCSPAAWLAAARSRVVSDPADVLPGYRALIDAVTARTGRRHYREAATLLAELRTACAACDESAAFGAFLADLRARHRRKSALLNELDSAGLR